MVYLLVIITYLILLYLLFWITYLAIKLNTNEKEMFNFYKEQIKNNRKGGKNV